MAQTLGILLTTSAKHEDAHTAIQLTRAALAQGRAVRIFVMCDGVYNLLDERFQDVAKAGAQISACGQNAEQRYVDAIEDVPNLKWGSQYNFAQITAECDRVIAFN